MLNSRPPAGAPSPTHRQISATAAHQPLSCVRDRSPLIQDSFATFKSGGTSARFAGYGNSGCPDRGILDPDVHNFDATAHRVVTPPNQKLLVTIQKLAVSRNTHCLFLDCGVHRHTLQMRFSNVAAQHFGCHRLLEQPFTAALSDALAIPRQKLRSIDHSI